MRLSLNILYLTGWILYICFSIITFPILGINASIPVIILLGLGAWLFGRTTGLLLIIPTTIYQAYLTSYLYADLLAIYQYKLSGFTVLISIVFLIGSLKNNHNSVIEITRKLDRLVEQRNNELHRLTAELLDNAERQRVSRGQELHDGMGQQLTGVQLLCASILNQLESENNATLTLAQSLESRTCFTHNHIRKLARMLFPVRISQVGLPASLSELASCICDLKPVDFRVEELADLHDIQESTALQIYRICQETTLHVIDNTDADEIGLVLNSGLADYVLNITHNGRSKSEPGCQSIMKLIHYRLSQISGTMIQSENEKGWTALSFNIPKTAFLPA